MSDLFWLIVLYHLVADFMTQPKETGIRKSEKGVNGLRLCVGHVSLYTLLMCFPFGYALSLFGNFSVKVIVFVYLAISVPHFVIDRWSLANKWGKYFKGRSFESAGKGDDIEDRFDRIFTGIVYVVIDQTMHLICLFVLYLFLKGGFS